MIKGRWYVRCRSVHSGFYGFFISGALNRSRETASVVP